MFSHTSLPNPAPGPTSVRKHCFLCFFCSFSCFFWFFNGFLGFSLGFIWFSMVLALFCWFLLFFNGFLWFYNGLEQFLIVFICFLLGFALFWVSPLWVFAILLVPVLVLQGKPKDNYWKTNPSRLRDLSGASFWASPSSVSACSGSPSPGLPLSLSLSSGLLRAPLAGSGPLLPLSFFFYA